MHFLSREEHNVLEYQLELFGIQGDFFQNYADVVNGYLFHFTLGSSIMTWDQPDFKFSLEFHWKHEIFGNLEDLQAKLEAFKQALLVVDSKVYEDIDQFAYIHLFIVPKDNQYQLVISSDTFNISKIINLK